MNFSEPLSPPDEGRSRPVGWVFGHVAALAVLGYLAFAIAPRAETLMADFGLPLSGPTALALAAARWVRAWWVPGLGLAALAVAADGYFLATVAPPRLGSTWGKAIAVGLIGLIVAFGVVMAAPLGQLMQRLSG